MSEQRKPVILIVDDQAMYIDVLRDILSPMYAIKPTIDGRLAVAMAEKYKPDLILLDGIMPYISGFEVLAALKASADTQAIPVIFISGLDSEEDEIKALTLGASDYIRKPFNKALVELRVKIHLKNE